MSLVQIHGHQLTGKEDVKYMRNTKGYPHICIDGYMLRRSRTVQGTSYWRCPRSDNLGYAMIFNSLALLFPI